MSTLVAAEWMLVGAAGRFACSFVSGIVFFGSNAPAGQPVAIYSALYNLSYIGPSLILCVIAGLALLPALETASPVAVRTA